MGPSGKAIAIEASPTIFKKLIANLQRNRVTNVEPYNLAASETEGTTKIFLASMSNEGETTILPTEDHWRYECDVPTKPLSTLISAGEMAKVRLIKIDVEGAEWFVVSGMRALLAHARQDLEASDYP